MIRLRQAHRRRWLALASVALILAGCGGGGPTREEFVRQVSDACRGEMIGAAVPGQKGNSVAAIARATRGDPDETKVVAAYTAKSDAVERTAVRLHEIEPPKDDGDRYLDFLAAWDARLDAFHRMKTASDNVDRVLALEALHSLQEATARASAAVAPIGITACR